MAPRLEIHFAGRTFRSLHELPVTRTDSNQAISAAHAPRTSVQKTKLPNMTLISYPEYVFPPSCQTHKFASFMGTMALRAFHQNHETFQPLRVCDVGTGSGVMAIACGKEVQRMIDRGLVDITATDIAPEALQAAEINAKANAVPVTFRQCDTLTGVTGKFDIIMSNPPYYPTEQVQSLDHSCAPIQAIDGGRDGMTMYRNLMIQSQEKLADHGFLGLRIDEWALGDVWLLAQRYLPGRETVAVANGGGRKIGLLIGDFTTVFRVNARQDSTLGIPVAHIPNSQTRRY